MEDIPITPPTPRDDDNVTQSGDKQRQNNHLITSSGTDEARQTAVDSSNKSCVRENSVKSILRCKARDDPSSQRSRSKSRSLTTRTEHRSKSRDKDTSKHTSKNEETFESVSSFRDDTKVRNRDQTSKDRHRSKSREKKKTDGGEQSKEDTEGITNTSTKSDDERKPRGRSKSKIRSKSRERSRSSVRSSESKERSTTGKNKEQKSEHGQTKHRSKSRDNSRKESSSDGKKHVIRIKLGSKDAGLEKLLASKADSFRDTEKEMLERLLVEHRLLMEEQQTLAAATDFLTKSNLELSNDLQKIRSDTRKVRLANQRIQQETHQLEDNILPVYRDNVTNLESTLEQQSCTGSFENSVRSLYQEAVRKMCKKVRKRPDQVELSEKIKVLAANEMAAEEEEESEEDLAGNPFPFDDCDVHLWDGSDATGLTLDEDGVYVDDNSESGIFNDNDSNEDDDDSTLLDTKRIG